MQKTNQSTKPMKFALVAAVAILAASCCPSTSPAPSAPATVAPSK
jgi:hypothetical protein